MPNALLESMACGLPVITSKLKGITDWVIKDGHNGLLCNTDNRKEFSETILLLLRDMSFTYNCGRSARKTIIEKFTIDKVSSKYEEIYNKLID